MIYKFSKSIIAFLNSKEVIEKDYMEVYQYGFEIVISSIFEVISVLLLSIIINNIWTGILYNVLMIIIRSNTGGYHADTYFRCNMIFNLVYLMSVCFLIFVSNCNIVNGILWVILLIAFIYVVCNAPTKNKNKILSEEQVFKSNKRSIMLYAFLCGSCLIMEIVSTMKLYSLNQYSFYIKIILIIIAITMFVGDKKECNAL